MSIQIAGWGLVGNSMVKSSSEDVGWMAMQSSTYGFRWLGGESHGDEFLRRGWVDGDAVVKLFLGGSHFDGHAKAL